MGLRLTVDCNPLQCDNIPQESRKSTMNAPSDNHVPCEAAPQDPPLGSDGMRRRDLMLTALKAAPVIVLLTARGARGEDPGPSEYNVS